MTQTIPVAAIDDPGFTDGEEDNVITDLTRHGGSTLEVRQYEKWKQKLRIQLIREQFEARKKKDADRRPVLLQLLRATCNH